MRTKDSFTWLRQQGEMAELIRQKDWAKTPFGPVETWPPSLRTMLGVALGSRFPMLIWWGPKLLHLYNDAYRPILRDKHPKSLGAPAAKIWEEVWDVAGPMADGVMAGGRPTWTEEIQLFIQSGKMAEETYFTFSYSPIPGEDGKVAGILNTVQETTVKVQSERQIQMLHSLAAEVSETKSEAQAYAKITDVLANYNIDIPFAQLFLIDHETSAVTLASNTDLRGYSTDIKDPSKWQLNEALQTQEYLVNNLSKIVSKIPKGQWGAAAGKAL